MSNKVRKNLMLIAIISFCILVLSGTSYALLRSSKTSQNNYSISIGDLEVTFQDGQTEKLNLSDMYPMTDEEGESQEKTLTFTVENTGTVGTYYDVYIEELSTDPEFKNVIRFISKKDEEEYKEPKTLSENKYIELTGYIEPRQTSTYKIKVWLMEEADKTYMKEEFKAKVVVNAYQEKNYAKDVIKSKLVKYEESSKEGFQGGLVAVNANGGLYNETEATQIIREYRYSGPTVNNYVTFNNETWRIIGVFKDENGQELVKIVRNEELTEDIMPDTYEASKKTFQIKESSTSLWVYWNYYGDDYYDNNWADAGLMHWLNSKGDENGYLKLLTNEAQNMIAKTKYYLGAITWKPGDGENSNGIMDTPSMAYNKERAISGCQNNIGSVDNTSSTIIEENNTCRVWANHAATWIGKIALMYLSDYGFSSNRNYWNTQMNYDGFYGAAANSNWLVQSPRNNERTQWLLSPASGSFYDVISWSGTYGWCNPAGKVWYGTGYVKPTLYLKSNVKIVDGDGSINNQYKLSID